jgi:murein DD-endopeptidase MepM/ murein hydrolase activator NlpD
MSGRSTGGLGPLAVLAAGAALLLGACSSNDEPPPWGGKELVLDIKPLDGGRLSSPFGWRERHPILKRPAFHAGIDWAAPTGTPVHAAGDGVVVAVRPRFGSYGNYVRIDHSGSIETAYAHLATFARNLRPGNVVTKGETIGRVGRTGRATGPHLHFELHVAGQPIDPMKAGSYALAPPLPPSSATTR